MLRSSDVKYVQTRKLTLEAAACPLPMSDRVLTCVVSHHAGCPTYPLESTMARNVEEIATRIRDAHEAACACGGTIGDEVWIANLSTSPRADAILGGIVSSYELLRPDMNMNAILKRVATRGEGFAAKVHLVVAGQ